MQFADFRSALLVTLRYLMRINLIYLWLFLSRRFYRGDADWIPVYFRTPGRSYSATEEAELNKHVERVPPTHALVTALSLTTGFSAKSDWGHVA